MKKEELLKLGFKDMRFTDEKDNYFKQFVLKINEVTEIESYGNSVVDICVNDEWINVPNCKTIDDMKNLIKLFS